MIQSHAGGHAHTSVELTILMPCLNEAETLVSCIKKAWNFLISRGIAGEVLIADNGSTDGSVVIAAERGARVVNVSRKGYGAALMGGIAAARGKYVIMGDADDSYNFSALDEFVAQLRNGVELVVGNRFAGGIMPGAMPVLHRYLGNPVLTFIGRMLYGVPLGDFHCGLRGFCRDSISRLNLNCEGMEFASEMIVKARLHDLSIAEVPTTLSPDGRSRPPHLNTWTDGWRHLRFLLLHSPSWLYFWPGLLILALGLGIQIPIGSGGLHLGRVNLEVNTMLFGSAMSIVGFQMLWFSIFAHEIATKTGRIPNNDFISRISHGLSLEKGATVGCVMFLTGLALAATAIGHWAELSFGNLTQQHITHITIPSVTLMVAGFETVIASFFLGIVNMMEDSKNGREIARQTKR